MACSRVAERARRGVEERGDEQRVAARVVAAELAVHLRLEGEPPAEREADRDEDLELDVGAHHRRRDRRDQVLVGLRVLADGQA